MVNENTTNFNYKRTITNVDYDKSEGDVKHKWLKGVMSKQITNPEKCELEKKTLDNVYFRYPNDSYFYCTSARDWGGAKTYGGIFLFLFIANLCLLITPPIEPLILVICIISLIGCIFFVTFYYTKPSKECILNRKDGLFTFPGFYWDQNITMPIENVIFRISGPGGTGGSAFNLKVQRPDRFKTQYLFTLGNNCYQDLSFVLWYMDKNRPLPPGDAFDEYRDQDFERRKAAGFPKPLFHSTFETPEATPEQQAERLMIAGW